MDKFFKPICTFLLLLFAFQLLGQSETDSLILSVELDDIVVTAQYAPTSAKEAVHRVEILNNEEWQARGLNTLSEVLQQQLNIRIGQDPILGAGISIQGIGGQNVQIMIDGVPVVGRLGGNIDLGQLNMNQFERVEIVKGSMSAQYGSNAAAGVINLISKKYQVNNWKIEAGAQTESFGINNQYFRLGRKIGHFQLDGGLSRYRASFDKVDSIRAVQLVTLPSGEEVSRRVVPWNPKDQFGYDLNFTFRPSDSLKIRYGYRKFNEELVLYGQIRRPVFRPYANDQYYTTSRHDHHLSAECWIAPNLYWQTSIGVNTFDRRKETLRLDVEPDTTSQVEGGQNTTVYTGNLVRSSINYLGKNKWSGQLGIEYFQESGKGARILDTAKNEPQPSIVNAAVWLSLRYVANPFFTIEGSVRGAYNSRFRHPVVPSVQMMWKSNNSWQWRLGYARGFRSPSIRDLFFNFIDSNHYILGNSEATAELSDNVHLSGQWEPKSIKRAVRFSGAIELFYNNITDRIGLVEFDTGRFRYDNLGKFETHGANLRTKIELKNWLELDANGAYTRLYNRFVKSDSNADKYIGLFELSNTLGVNLNKTTTQFRVNHRFIGRRDVYSEDTDGNILQGFIEGFHLVDLSINQGFWHSRFRLNAGVKNIFNQERAAVGGSLSSGGHSGGAGGQLVAFGRNCFIGLHFLLN